MHFVPLLGKQLKSEEIVDLLELWDVEVIYDFDRLWEGMADQYTASCHDQGIELRFDEDQVLRCIFLYLTPPAGFSRVELASSDIKEFENPPEVAAHAASIGLPTSSGQAKLEGIDRDWIKIEADSYTLHYEFRGQALAQITLMSVPER